MTTATTATAIIIAHTATIMITATIGIVTTVATHKTIIRTTPTMQTILETVVIIEITMAVTELVTHRQISRRQDSRNNMISINKDSAHRHIIPKHTV